MKTDQQLKQDVIAELGWEPAVNASQIGVEVKDGIVTLAGHVDSFTEKWQAEKATQRVAGVKGLAVEMDVKLPGMSNRTDADVARSVENTLQWLSYLPTDAVKVIVENGWVTLSGEVDWNYQRLNAAAVVRDLMGVRGLTENIGIKSRAVIPSSSIEADIEAALRRRLDSNLQDISVAVHDGDVTLSGRVQSLWDRERALGLAWSSAGVKHVRDDLRISFG
jgi:osmotically-inducible protein OsmY